jgi:CRP-like cAMP-binding protein
MPVISRQCQVGPRCAAQGDRPSGVAENRFAAKLAVGTTSPNWLLAGLGDEDLERLCPHLETVPLERRHVLYNSFRRIEFVHFIESGIASLMNVTADGASVEIGTIGNEGIVGLPVIFGDDAAPTSVLVQAPGRALRIRTGMLRREMERSGSLRTVLLRYAHTFFNQVAQSAACAHFHSLEQRCCTWLLKTDDRVGSDEFALTQEALATMLAVRRPGVTSALGILRRAGLVGNRRGRIAILDRRGLEERACECYAITKVEYDRLEPSPSGRGPSTIAQEGNAARRALYGAGRAAEGALRPD